MSEIIMQMYLGLGVLGLTVIWGVFNGMQKHTLQPQPVLREKLERDIKG